MTDVTVIPFSLLGLVRAHNDAGRPSSGHPGCSLEVTKLILSSMDYTRVGGIPRVVLEIALASKDIVCPNEWM